MGRPGSVTWLHLSDLHLCQPKNGIDRRRVLKTLKDDLRLLGKEQGLEPDLIFVTGDLAYGHLGEGPLSLEQQYREVQAYVDEVRNLFGPPVAKDRVFFVPGNHDVDRRRAPTELTEWLDSRSSWKDVDDLIRDGKYRWEQYAARLHAYRDFLASAGYPHLLDDSERLIYSQVVEVGGVRIGVAGLNTAWSCARPREWGRVWVGRWQIDALLQRIEDAHLKIALMHHPCRSVNEHETTKLDHDLTRDFHFCLHGHEHQMFLDVIDRGRDHDDGHHRVAAGATYQGSEEENAYSVVRLDLTKPQGEVWMRKYDREGDGWIPKVIHKYTDDHGVWRLDWSLGKIAKDFRSARPVVTPAAVRPVRQGAAVCVRRNGDGLEFLLIKTSRGRWLFPKKRMEQDETPLAAASRAAEREAGVSGLLHEEKLIDFHYFKDGVIIAAFLLFVAQEKPAPKPERQPTWHPAEEAVAALMKDRPSDEWWPLISVMQAAWRRMSEDGEDADRL